MEVSDLFRSLKKFGLENSVQRYYSFYPAKVTSNTDPEGRGRVKIIVPDIGDEIQISDYAEPMILNAGKDLAAASSRTGGKFGSFYPPKKGDWVWCTFRHGDIKYPLYFGSWWSRGETPDFISTDRKNAVFISRYGHEITVDETTGKEKITIKTNKESTIEIDDTTEAEKILIQTAKKSTITLDDTKEKEKIQIQTGLNKHTILMDDTKDNEQVSITAGKSQNKLVFKDVDGEESITLSDKNGDSWQWDVKEKKWLIKFDGDKEEEITKSLKQTVTEGVEQIFQKSWKVSVSENGDILLDGKLVINAKGAASFWSDAITHLGAETGQYAVPLGELLLQALNINVILYNTHVHPSAAEGPPTPPSITMQNIANSTLSQKVKTV